MRVIVVEDDPVNALLFERLLGRRGGYDVLVTEDAYELLAEARGQDVAMVLMDVSLSSTKYEDENVDGIRLTQLLRADPRTADIPVLLATAHAMRGDKEDLLERSGADGYVSKPISDHAAFMDLVQALIEQRTGAGTTKERS